MFGIRYLKNVQICKRRDADSYATDARNARGMTSTVERDGSLSIAGKCAEPDTTTIQTMWSN